MTAPVSKRRPADTRRFNRFQIVSTWDSQVIIHLCTCVDAPSQAEKSLCVDSQVYTAVLVAADSPLLWRLHDQPP